VDHPGLDVQLNIKNIKNSGNSPTFLRIPRRRLAAVFPSATRSRAAYFALAEEDLAMDLQDVVFLARRPLTLLGFKTRFITEGWGPVYWLL